MLFRPLCLRVLRLDFLLYFRLRRQKDDGTKLGCRELGVGVYPDSAVALDREHFVKDLFAGPRQRSELRVSLAYNVRVLLVLAEAQERDGVLKGRAAGAVECGQIHGHLEELRVLVVPT